MIFFRLKEELTEERQRYKKLQDSSVKDKDTIVNLELKVNEIETENLEKEMKSKDLEIKANSLERQLKKFEVSRTAFILFLGNQSSECKHGHRPEIEPDHLHPLYNLC